MHLKPPLVSQIQSFLLRWYKANKRDLPWRRNPTLYTTVLSEFMLQQTRVDQVIPYFNRFLKKFPTLKRLAEAPFEHVIKLWEGLGYYRRAKNLHETIKQLAAHKKVTLDLLRGCPGIGDYTLAAVSSIAWGELLAVVDGNVKRVIARFLAIEKEIEKPDVDRLIRKAAGEWLYRNASGDWNQAMMELGATVCLPRNPLCTTCPLHFGCKAFKIGRAEDFPKRIPKNPRPHKFMASAVIVRRNGEILITQRPNRGLLSNLWEFPNFEISQSDFVSMSPPRKRGSNLLDSRFRGNDRLAYNSLSKKNGIECSLKESLYKNLRIKISVGKKIAVVDHAYSHFSVTMQAYLCRLIGGATRSADDQKWKWAKVQSLSKYPFPKVHKPVVDFLQS